MTFLLLGKGPCRYTSCHWLLAAIQRTLHSKKMSRHARHGWHHTSHLAVPFSRMGKRDCSHGNEAAYLVCPSRLMVRHGAPGAERWCMATMPNQGDCGWEFGTIKWYGQFAPLAARRYLSQPPQQYSAA